MAIVSCLPVCPLRVGSVLKEVPLTEQLDRQTHSGVMPSMTARQRAAMTQGPPPLGCLLAPAPDGLALLAACTVRAPYATRWAAGDEPTELGSPVAS